MFALRSLSSYLFGKDSRGHIIDISQGQLYSVRSSGAKSYSQLAFKDATAYICSTGQEYQYQLVVQRAYEEGEEDANEHESGDPVEDLEATDENVFLLDQDLQFHTDLQDTGETVLIWKDLADDEEKTWFEFVCDPTTRPETVKAFELVVTQCLYERKYRRSHQQATAEDLDEFRFEESIPALQIEYKSSPTPQSSIQQSRPSFPLEDFSQERSSPASDIMALKAASSSKVLSQTPTKAPLAKKAPIGRETLAKESCQLHLFDFTSGSFVLQDADVHVTVSEIGKWDYWLQITSDQQEWLGQEVVPDLNPVFNFEYLSFIFNHYTDDGSAYSWLLKFEDRETEERFQEGLMQALWEHLNQTKWQKAVKDADRDYVLDAFNDLVLEDAHDDERERQAAEEDEEEEDEEESDDGRKSEHYDTDEDEDDVDIRDEDGNVNSQLAVGAAHDRSFVVRGDKIGVFKHTPDNHLEFATSINKVQTPGGKGFAPKKVMLHSQDRDMVLQSAANPNSLFRMDLEYGKVVDEWKVHDDIPVNIFAPENKFAQTSGEQTMIGLSSNALYRIDPRLAGNKLVDSELKQYASKNDFSAAATTEKGYIAVASNKGDIRMFDRLGIQAKTALPALGDPIIGLDVSADGRWVLATTRTYLLLIDALQQSGKNEGKLGFEKSFAKDSKPQPRRLGLTPSHVAQFQHETKSPLSFTPARFNIGEGKDETTIITSTGPFIVTWSMKKVLQGRKDPYSIKRYSEEVKADNFRYGSDKNIIVALPNEVDMVARRALQRPTRESIAAPPATPRRSKGRGSYLSRNEIVNSPY
ncbi:VID27-domain-containing protein [Polychaeton citri CBS 116435]|uniref:VID27-domain-containing protein n=1 Tax=Polychaeton citri CBS 116435 TaxID=1314669 RepID=A0A9P4UJZ1_9PEZI|nr:VID27-domain-containing protein [Polychaeton citri CBS 116435]